MDIFTIETLLKAAPFPGLELAAGKRNTDNVISGANIIDNPDTYDWIRPGDFLLTTGYLFREDEEQLRLIRELSELNCAGLGIKVHRYWNAVPDRIVAEADRAGLPVVQIPFRYSLSQIVSYINTQLFHREETMLRRYQDDHAAFFRCAVEGGGLDEIARLASERIGDPVLVTDSEWRLLTWHELPGDPVPLEETLRLVRGEPCFSEEFTRDVPSDPARLTASLKRHFPDGEGDVVCRLVPVVSGETLYGFITVWETMRKITGMDYVTLEMAAGQCAVERVKARQMEEAAHRQRRSFFDDLLQNRIASAGAIRSMSRIHGLDADRPYVCAVIQVDQAEVEEAAHRRVHELLRLAESTAREHGQNLVAFHRMNMVILLIQTRKTAEDQRIDGRICTFLEDLDDRMEKSRPPYIWQIGVSGVCKNALHLSQAYNNAVEAIRLAGGGAGARRIHYLTEMLSLHFLSSTLDKNKAAEFVNGTLGRLIEYDRRCKAQLTDTLESYFACGQSIVDTAQALFIHKNSLRYRLERIQKILGSELNDAEYCFTLQLALHLRKLL